MNSSDADDFYKNEIIRLENELDKTNFANRKAAELGLAAIADKEVCEKKFNEYKLLYEQCQKELLQAQEALRRVQLTQLHQSQESFSEEEHRQERHSHAFQELTERSRVLEKELRIVKNERDRLEKENAELARELEVNVCEKHDREVEKERNFDKLRECEKRETKMLTDLSELEDENLTLQKQIVALRVNQMQTDTLKMEIENLKEQKIMQDQKLEDVESIKNMLKKQLDETSQILDREKLSRQTLKREVERLKIFSNIPIPKNGYVKKIKDRKLINNDKDQIYMNGDGKNHDFLASDYDEFLAISTNAEILDNILKGSNSHNGLLPNGNSLDNLMLYDHNDPNGLKTLNGSMTSMICALDLSINPSVTSLGKHRHKEHMNECGSGDDGSDMERDRPNAQASDLFSEMNQAETTKLRQEISAIAAERDCLAQKIRSIKDQQINNQNETDQQKSIALAQLNTLVDQINNKLILKWLHALQSLPSTKNNDNKNNNNSNNNDSEGHSLSAHNDSNGLADNNTNNINLNREYENPTTNSLTTDDQTSGKVPTIINTLCQTLNSLQRNCDTLGAYWESTIYPALLQSTKQSNSGIPFGTNMTQKRPIGARDASPSSFEDPNDASSTCTTENINGNYVTANGHTNFETQNASAENLTSESVEDYDSMLKEIQKLKAIIVNKRCKNAHYREVLTAYKTTAESCFSRMKTKYAEERKVVTDTLTRYRKELAIYKEDCLAIGGQLSAARKEARETALQIDALEKKCEFLDAERKTLNAMLKTAIQQKFALIQRVENLECFNFFSQPNADESGDDEADHKNNADHDSGDIKKNKTKSNLPHTTKASRDNNNLNKGSKANLSSLASGGAQVKYTPGSKFSIHNKSNNTDYLNSHSNSNSLMAKLSNLTAKHYYYMGDSNDSLKNATNGKPKNHNAGSQHVSNHEFRPQSVEFIQPTSSSLKKPSSHFVNKAIEMNKQKQQLLAHMFLKPHLTSRES